MIYYALVFFAWLLGVLCSVGVATWDGQWTSRRAAEDALREALVWPLVWIPWREWFTRAPVGRHRLVA